MQSRTFSNIISSRLAFVKSNFDLRRGVLSLAALLAFAVTGDMARAQVTNPTSPTEQPTQKNPAPRAGGDAQNRNRAHDDKYWNVTDANRRYFELPFSRIPDPNAVARGNGRLVADGWQFPQPRPGDFTRTVLDFGEGPAATIPAGALPAGFGIRYFAAPWVSVTAPSTNFIDADYQRAPAVPRLATAIPADTLVGPAPYPNNSVKWFPNIPGPANTLRRFTIRVFLPTPEPFPTDGTLASETRVEDARYLVYYQARVGGVLVTRVRSLLRSQSGSGWVTLTDSNNQPILFPMATEATGLTGAARPRVELDNTTQDDTGQRFVIADQIQFVPSSEYGEIKAPTTVTPIHGGRKIDFTTPPVLGEPYNPANQLFQPDWTTEPGTTPYALGLTAPNSAFPNDSFDFINNPRQINYPGNAEEVASPGTVTNTYTDTTLPYYQPFESWNPSTLFQGPRSLIDDQTDTTVAGRENGIVPAARTNQGRYEYAISPTEFRPRPLFSHMQVLVPRTEYVPDPNSIDGLGSLAVGCVYGVDWLTGTPIWRFPDRTHLPRSAASGVPGLPNTYVEPGTASTIVRNSGLRNPNVADQNGNAIPVIPGIGAYDKNGDGYIADEEVYLVGQGANPSGGIEAGITLAPRNYTRADEDGTTVPVYNDAWNPYTSPTPGPGFNSSATNATSIVGVVNVPIGRYSGPENDASDGFPKPVAAGMALVASNNGVIYAIDPYGNNDNRYYNYEDGAGVDTTRFGTFRSGSTNAFWTFSVTAPVRGTTESNESYNQKLKQSIPATGPWGRSTPVIAYAKEETDATLNRFVEEPRLFIGNSNGVLYAINAQSDAGFLVDVDPDPMVTILEYRFGTFPFRKESHIVPVIGSQQPDLRWWFETEAAITAAPAVSASIHPRIPGSATLQAKGVYVTSNDGRVYSLDWNGPVTKTDHNTSLNFTGTTTAAQRTSAELLNDNGRFHNANATTEFAIADGTEGTIRPRWVFPSRYRDIDGGNNSELAPIDPPDSSNVIPGALVERQTRLAPINSAPSLIDYPFDSDLTTTTNAIVIKQYVAVVANDLNGSDAPIRGRVYLLDQVGDRRDFSVKPVARTAAQTGGTAIAFGQPDDMYAPTEYVFSDATPAWTYRPVYKRYTDAGVTEDIPLRNRPNQLNNLNGATAEDPTATGVAGAGLPEKRNLPTLFVGGPLGRLFALDIDPETGLFLRWRGSIAATRAFTPLPTSFTDAVNLPVNEPVARRLFPPNPVLEALNLTARPPLVRTISLLDTEDVASITISGGQQNRNHPYATAAPVNGPTVPGLPTNDAPSLLNPGVPYVLGTVTTPPPAGTVPITGVRPPFWDATNVANYAAGTPLDFTLYPLINVPSFDFSGRFVNQDHDDPVATTFGSYPDPRDATVDPGASLAAIAPEQNRAYQYPILAVTTTDGSFTLVSTELEGLDSVTVAQGADTEAVLGWGFTSDPRLANPIRPVMMSRGGPGGPGTSVAIITNANYGAMDPGFRNTVQKQAGVGTTPADPSRDNFPYYPWYEPLNVGVIAVADAPYDDPRPRFEPRSLYSGNSANPNGPDADPTTGDGWPEIKADAHTGRTGFPLDLRGLFYDKKFAANPLVVGAPNANDDGLLRLPAYTGIGEALAAANRRERRGQNNRLIPPLVGTATYDPVGPDPLDGTPDTPRDSSTGATAPWRTNPDTLFPGAPVLFPVTGGQSGSEADINPPGTNITWLFVGGSDGTFYSYTPNRYSVPGAGPNLGSGFVGGNPRNDPNQNPALFGNAKVLLVNEATFNAISTTPRRPDPATDDLLITGKPFYEYGENIYAIVYDIGPSGGTLVDANGDGIVSEPTEAVFPATVNVSFRPYNGTSGRAVGSNVTSTVLIAAPVQAFRYPFDATTQMNRPLDPSLVNAPRSDRAIALLRIQVNTNFNEGGGGGRRASLTRGGSSLLGWTPGAIYEMSVNGFSGLGVGATQAEVVANTQPLIAIANPLAVQAFLLSNQEDRLATVADPENTNRIYNNIGPFFSDNGAAVGSVKNRVATSANLAAGNTALYDPDRALAEYNQALTNGNRVSRFDLAPFGTGGVGTRNVNYGKPLISTVTGTGIEASYEPTFYLPVAASAGMIDHGKPGSTNVATNKKTLRIVNRSLQGSLGKLRVELRSDALFRSWPGTRPNVRPNDSTVTFAGLNVGAVATTGNPRLTPSFPVDGRYRMRADGIVNYLPWEQPVVSSLPWERDSATLGIPAALSNSSRDYPDIAAQSESASNQQIVKVITPSGDLLRSSGSLSASVGGTGAVSNLTVSDASIRDWLYSGTGGNFQAATAAVQIEVPKFQPANLVAMHSLTSTYVKPSADESPADASADGDIQLPRRDTDTSAALGRAFNDRGLRATTNSYAGTGDVHTITPMGYTLQMRAYLDINGDGTFDATEPYRDFETWFGVPVDVSIKQSETGVELPGAKNAAFVHGTGQQNGYMGYGATKVGGNSIGFLPKYLQDTNDPALANLLDPYNPFFAPITVQSESNVNLWNVRASQKIEMFKRLPDVANPAGNGRPYGYFAMQSENIDQRFGILAVESDPTDTNPTGIMPNVVTSLDKKFDAAWNIQFNAPATRLFNLGYNPLRIPVANIPGALSRYDMYYAGFGGRHTLHKPAAGSKSATVLSVPDVPSASLPATVSPGPTANDPSFPAAGVFLPPVQGEKPTIGVAVPLGTPSGTYSNNRSGTPLAFFEDHDTQELPANAGYSAIPLPSGATNNALTILPAGPLYNNQNILHPGQIPVDPILPATGEGVLRPRRIVGIDNNNTPANTADDVPIYEYLPSTTVTTNNNRVAFNISVVVKESPLTGQIADQALANGIGFPVAIVNGALPGIDNVPLFDYTNIAANDTPRPVSALAPAAYRTASGNMVLFHNSNARSTTNGRQGDARPGAPFNLFQSVLRWNSEQGTWQAANRGYPIDGTQLFTPAANYGSWFGTPTQLTIGNAANESNLSPFVLHDPMVQGGLNAAQATLFVMNVVPTSSGEAQYTPYFAPLDAVGTPPTNFTPLLPLTGDTRIDPTLRRFSPRAAYVPSAEAAFVMYYGGGAGKNNILYVPAPANGNGGVTGAGVREIALRLPASVTSASDPMPIVRQVRIVDNGQGVWIYSPTAPLQYVVDVHYTAVLRSGGSADICISRYRVTGTGAGARLQPIDMPVQAAEKLSSASRAPVYRSKHFGWYNRLDAPGNANAPIIQVTNTQTGAVIYTTDPAKWQLDNATKLLFQKMNGTNAPLVYVDTSAGVVTFRGTNAPSNAAPNLTVRATYLPLAYRIAATDAVESSTFGFMDRTKVFSGVDANGLNIGQHRVIGDGIEEYTLGGLFSGVKTRYNTWDTSNGQGIDRQWLYWQRSSSANQPATLYFTTRRVGVDLKALGVLTPAQSLQLSTGPVNPYQTVLVNMQAVTPSGNVDIPFEVDYASGKIFTQASLEGLLVEINGFKVTSDTAAVPEAITAFRTTLTPIDEVTGESDGVVGRALLPLARRVNENQPYAFLDVFDASYINRTTVARTPANGSLQSDDYPESIFDPALQAGKVWMFWSSSRGRTGLARVPNATYSNYFNIPIGEAITTSGYDLFWETLAPNFGKLSTSGFPQ